MLSVVIITRNAREYAKSCIDSVLEAIKHKSVEIIVVDNGSTDETVEILKNYRNSINFIQLEKNYGVAYARNVALRAVNGDFIWILDIDTVANREAADKMLNYLENNLDCGLCSCRLQSNEGEVQDSCRHLPYPKYKIMNLLTGKLKKTKIKEKIEKINEKQFYRKELSGREPFEAEYVIGACQMFRKKILDEVGYLDEKIFYGPEDADFCLRINRKGYKIVCLPDCYIIHHYNRVSNKKIFSRMAFLHFKGLLYFYMKLIFSYHKFQIL